ncbi:hypothetical protein K8R32_00885 [bacterium]|nr:hypothetical protein [bacterium]
MKTILFVLPDHFSVRNFIYSPFIEQNFLNKAKIIFVVHGPQNHLNRIKNKSNIILEDISHIRYPIYRKFTKFLILKIHTILNFRFSTINKLKYLIISENTPSKYKNKKDTYPWYIRKPFPYSRIIFKFFCNIYNSTLFSEIRSRELINQYNPDLLITTNPQAPATRPYYIEAKKRNIQTLAYVNSWDYLTTDGPVMKKIDQFIVWNKKMKDEMVNVQNSKKPIHIIGPIHMDFSFTPGSIFSKEKFYQTYKINPAKKIITYGVMGARFGKHEPEVAEYLAKKISKNKDLHLILRGHPEDQTIPDRFKEALKYKNVTLCMGIHFHSKEIKNIDDRIILYSLMSHSDLIICGPTTLTLDAIQFDKPVINIGFDGSKLLPKEASVLNICFTNHFGDLLSHKGTYLVKNFKELDNAIENALKNPSHLASGRKKIKENYLEPLDGKASERLFNLLLS